MKKNTVITLKTAQFNFTAHPLEVGAAYLAAASQAATPEKRDEILAVEEKFIGLNDRDLYLAAHEDGQAAPLIGGSKIKASTLKWLAKFELEERERKRSDREGKRSDRKWLITIIASGVIALIGWGVAIFLALNK